MTLLLGWVSNDEPAQNSAKAERESSPTSAEDRGPNGIPDNPVKSAARIWAGGILSSAWAAVALVSRA